MTITVVIKFTDGTRISIEDAMEYGYQRNDEHYYVEKNGFNVFFPREHVVYIGKEILLEEG